MAPGIVTGSDPADDPYRAHLIDAWPTLPEHLIAAALTIVLFGPAVGVFHALTRVVASVEMFWNPLFLCDFRSRIWTDTFGYFFTDSGISE